MVLEAARRPAPQAAPPSGSAGRGWCSSTRSAFRADERVRVPRCARRSSNSSARGPRQTEIVVTFRHLEDGWVDTPEPRRESRRRRRGGRGRGGRGERERRSPGRPRTARRAGGRPAWRRAPPRGRARGLAVRTRTRTRRRGPPRPPSPRGAAPAQSARPAPSQGARAAAPAARRPRRGTLPGRARAESGAAVFAGVGADAVRGRRWIRPAVSTRAMNFELTEDQRRIRDAVREFARARDRARSRRAGEVGPLSERDPRQARGDGHPRDDGSRGVRRRGRRRALLHPRRRGAGARLRLDRGHRVRHQLGRLLPDLEVRHRGAEEDDPAASSPPGRRSAPTR